jgi:hypothetical protein
VTQIPSGKLGGCLPRETKCGEGAFPAWGTDGRCPLLPTDLLREFIAEDRSPLVDFHWHTINQSQQSSCTASDLGNLMMLCRAVEGKLPVVLSQASIYAYDGITIRDDGSYTLRRRRSDNGMNLEVAMLIAQCRGMTPTDYVSQYDWKQKNWPDDVSAISARFRLGEAWDVPDYWSMLSAVKLGFGVARGMDNHCVGQIHPRLVLGSWEDYGVGDNGLHEWGTTEREINRGISQFGAWAFRCTAASDASVVLGCEPPIEDAAIRRRRRQKWGEKHE